jgi:hypothetical protein
MSGRFVQFSASTIAISVMLIVLSPGIGAAELDAAAPLDAYLAAGEFAPAAQFARQATAPAARDAWFARIAAAQAAAGARDAAVSMASEITDDRARSQALGGIAGQPISARGGNSLADFDSLISLITSTVNPTSWDAVGGPGSVVPFPSGVYVDPQGVMRPVMKTDASGQLAALRAAGAWGRYDGDARRPSSLRIISLPRLEKQVQLRLASGRQPTEAMTYLAGLERIEYVLVYPASGDLVIAGPAGDWGPTLGNRVVSKTTGLPVVRLDDLVVVLRHMMSGADARFGCAITPTQDALARVQVFLGESKKQAISPGQRSAWLERLRSQLGQQEIDVYGLDPRTRAARIMVEADHHMKLVGMGLADGVRGVRSYLDSIEVPPGAAPPPMGVLRWWFTLNYDAVFSTADRQAFALRGQGVQVLSENELLTRQGQRVHTGESDDLNREFAQSFTANFEALVRKYPVYAELRNLFDLAVAASLIREEDLPGKVNWHMTCFGNPAMLAVELGRAATHVETVVNHRVVNRVHIVAGVSGGVRVDPSALVTSSAVRLDEDGRVAARHKAAAPKSLPSDAWWWDAVQ